MRLFGKRDGAVDRLDRAEWLTPPFDLAFSAAAAKFPGDTDWSQAGVGDSAWSQAGVGRSAWSQAGVGAVSVAARES